MQAVSQDFKNNIKTLGREIDAVVSFRTEGNYTYTDLGVNDINSISIHYEGGLLKSVMKQLDIDSNVNIPVGSYVNLKYGIKVGDTYEYIDYASDYAKTYGTFIVYSSEKQEDLKSYKIVCYDRMLYAMKEYEKPSNVVYPITIRDYLNAICTHLELTFKNKNMTFPNYDKQIPEELYLDADGNSLDYIFRDVLDDIAQVVAGTLCINKNNELEIRYLNNACVLTQDTTFTENKDYYTKSSVQIDSVRNLTNNQATQYRNKGWVCNRVGSRYTCTLSEDQYTLYEGDRSGNPTASNLNEIETINEEYLKDINVNFGEQYGAINTITFKRTEDLDVYSLSNPTDLADNLKNQIVISNNQILNGENRSTFAQAILDKLYGTTFYLNDYKSTGIGWLELCDKYNVSIGNVIYPCVMLNDELNITQGLEENVFTDRPKESETDYSTASKSEREDNRASIIIDKKIGEVDIRGKNINLTSDNITISSTNFSVDETGNITANSGDIGGFHIGADRLWNRIEEGDYTMEDVYGASQYIIKWPSMTDAEKTAFLEQYGFSSVAEMFAKWDVAPIGNPDGVINISDVMAMEGRFVDFSASGIDLVAGKDNTPGSIQLSGAYSDEAVKISADGSITLNKKNSSESNTLKIGADKIEGNPVIQGSTERVQTIKSNVGAMTTYKHSGTDKSIGVGVGDGGYNRGIYDDAWARWMLYADQYDAYHLGGNWIVDGSIKSKNNCAFWTNQSITWSANWSWQKMIWSGVSYNNTGIVLSSNQFYIPANVSIVKVSISASYYNIDVSGDKNIAVFKNGAYQTQLAYVSYSNANPYIHVSGFAYVSVAQNDYLSIHINSGNTGTMRFFESTNILIEPIA